jgi:putative ABC transport system permease protein
MPLPQLTERAMLTDLLIRLRALSRRKAVESELDDELRFHFDQQVEKYVNSGLAREKALRRARLDFGSLDQVKEECRDARGVNVLETLAQDVRYGLRMLRKSPGFTAVALLTLALGIGANTTIFSVVNAVLLRPLPYPDPARLVRIYQTDLLHGRTRMMNSAVDLNLAREQTSAIQNVAFYQEGDATLTGVDEPEQIADTLVSPGFFSTLGVTPVVGRAFQPGEHQEGNDHVVILSYSLWRRLFNGEPGAIGKTVTLNGNTYTVVGVMPEGFHFPRTDPPIMTNAWFPWSETPEQEGRNKEVAGITRLAKGVSLEKSQAEMNAVSDRLKRTFPDDAEWQFEIVPLQRAVAGDSRLPILVIFGAVSFVLLIACANVANLLLARAAGRQREMAVRAAIGASRFRLIRQVLTESVLLSFAGGIAGLAVAIWGVRILRSAAPTDIPRLADVQISPSVLLFTLAASFLVGIVFGLVPALQVSKSPLQGGLRNALMTFHAKSGRRSLNRFLLVSQLALSLVLLAGAGLMARSFLLLTSVDLGFQPKNILTFWTGLSGARFATPDSRISFDQQTLQQIQDLPGVDSAALASSLPLTGPMGVSVRIEGRPAPPRDTQMNVAYQAITPAYFQVMRIPLIEGRLLSESDAKGAPAVVVVNREFVKKFFPNEDPLGKRIRISLGGSTSREVVGVAGDVREAGLAQGPAPEVYLPLFQSWVSPGGATYLVRTNVEPLSLAPSIRREISLVDKDRPIALIQTMDHILSDASAQPRFRTNLLSLFSLLALVLTAVGLYGVMAYTVAQRSHEIGVRMALGARPRQILRLVAREGASLVGAGILLGLAGALALTRFLESLLYEIKPTDPAVFVGVAVLLAVVAFGACYFPARRAMRVDPMVALRHE